MEAGIVQGVDKIAYDPRNDVAGIIDAVIKSGNGDRVLQIIPVNDELFSELSAPLRRHVDAQNFMMGITKVANEGILYYVNVNDPGQVRTFSTVYDPKRFRTTISNIQQARAYASELLRSNAIPTSYGRSYSRIDRLRVLSKTAPWDPKYDLEKKYIKEQIKAGQLSTFDEQEFEKIEKQRRDVMKGYELYPRRFTLGQIMSPDRSQNLELINEELKTAADYSIPERVVGGLWETLQRWMPFRAKTMPYFTPRESYEKYEIQGSRFTNWSTPIDSFIMPHVRALTGSDVSDSTKAAMSLGFIFGGPIGMFIGAQVGMPLAVARNALTSESYRQIPSDIQNERKINTYFDQLEYEKANALLDRTGDREFADQMSRTMTSNPGTVWQLMRAAPDRDRGYVMQFAQETNPMEQSKILNLVDPEMQQVLLKIWGRQVGKTPEGGRASYWKNHRLPSSSWTGWNRETNIDDYRYKTYEQEGLNSRAAGLGWIEQSNRVKEMGIEAMNWYQVEEYDRLALASNPGEVEAAIRAELASIGVELTRFHLRGQMDDGSIHANVRVFNNRTQEIAEISNMNAARTLWPG
jgi:hypothetical protein